VLRRNGFWIAVALVSVASSTFALGQPRLVMEKPAGYQIGDVIEPEVFVDRDLQRHSLVSLIKPDVKVVALVIFGGAALRSPDNRPHRGPLWCEDSFDDMTIERALVAAFQHDPVQFIGVAVPPVYNPSAYGYSDKAFLGFTDASPEFLENARRFVDACEVQEKTRLIPFSEVYYDLKYRLAGKLKTGEGGVSDSERYPWEGKLRWREDPRNYGVPIVWLLGPEGRILQAPFFGNDWGSDPPQVQYEYHDVKAAIEKYLGAAPGQGTR
jgi:hypothetical protein